MTRIRVALIGLIVVPLASQALAQVTVPLRFKQERDNSPIQALTAAEVATLGDPLFNLVLKSRADIVTLACLEKAIQPDQAKRSIFVVDEQIVRSSRPAARRAVIAFDGSNGGESLKGNVMLSITFGPESFPDEINSIEAWGWDNHRTRYNYYKMDATGTADGKPIWKLRGTSDSADMLKPNERTGTCMACHINGAPVMKELFKPWNNWHSPDLEIEYLQADSGTTDHWPVASDPRFRASLQLAETLEADFMISALKRFNGSRVNRAIKRLDDTGDRMVSPDGFQTILEGRRLLRPLFETTEFNLISSRDKSGRHPLGAASDFLPTLTIRWPASLFLNAPLIAGGGAARLSGLKITDALRFQNLPRLTQQDNLDLLTEFKVRLAGEQPGDANFALFAPEPAFIDNDLVDQLLQQGIITPHFLAAVLALDLENPILSSRRRDVLRFVPDQFDFKPVAPGGDPTTLPRVATDDKLTQAVIAAIEASAPPSDSAAAFLALLKQPNAVSTLKTAVSDYLKRVRGALESNDPMVRSAEQRRIYKKMLDARQAVLRDPTLKALDETGGQFLLPLP